MQPPTSKKIYGFTSFGDGPCIGMSSNLPWLDNPNNDHEVEFFSIFFCFVFVLILQMTLPLFFFVFKLFLILKQMQLIKQNDILNFRIFVFWLN